MDVGSYTVHQLRLLGGEEPKVISAHAQPPVAESRPVDAGRRSVA